MLKFEDPLMCVLIYISGFLFYTRVIGCVLPQQKFVILQLFCGLNLLADFLVIIPAMFIPL